MASSWGSSWGLSWGSSWGSVAAAVTSVGSSISGGTFSRGRWRKLKELLAAEKAADAKALALRATAKKKLTAAVKVARAVTDISADDGKRITLAFDAAFGARTLADVIRQADIVLDFAKRAALPKPQALEPPPAQDIEPEPEPIRRRQLRERPDRALSPLEAVTYDIDSLLEDHRVAALERGRTRNTALARERERKRRIAERKALIARACQAHMAEAINTLIDTLNKSAVRR